MTYLYYQLYNKSFFWTAHEPFLMYNVFGLTAHKTACLLFIRQSTYTNYQSSSLLKGKTEKTITHLLFIYLLLINTFSHTYNAVRKLDNLTSVFSFNTIVTFRILMQTTVPLLGRFLRSLQETALKNQCPDLPQKTTRVPKSNKYKSPPCFKSR